jgi:hypothetical protein
LSSENNGRTETKNGNGREKAYSGQCKTERKKEDVKVVYQEILRGMFLLPLSKFSFN